MKQELNSSKTLKVTPLATDEIPHARDQHAHGDSTLQPATSKPESGSPTLGQTETSDKKPKRTLGLKLFDIGLYPILSNVAVIAVSIVATFLTARGGDKKDGKLIYGSAGRWMQKRGEWMEKKFQNWFSMSPENAEMGKVVAFSFIDGSLFAPLVKLLEDRREKISLWIDEKLGTKSENLDAYKAEPKQSWGSVLSGRAVTAGIVIPTAIALSRKDFTQETVNGKAVTKFTFGNKGNKSLNDLLFNDPSERHLGKFERLENSFNGFIKRFTGGLKGIFAKDPIGIGANETIQVPEVGENKKVSFKNASQGKTAYKTFARMTYFETFYTSVCTAGLYFGSRLLARKFNENKEQKNNAEIPQTTSNAVKPLEKKADISPVANAQRDNETHLTPEKMVVAQASNQSEKLSINAEQRQPE